jgi:phosphoglycerate dehydrogenase-like enzyme
MPFRIALTGDFYDDDGQLRFKDIGVDRLQSQPEIEVVRFGEHRPEIGPDQIADVNGVLVLTPRTTAQTLTRSENLLAIARFGVGYDNVDVAACTAHDVVLTIAAGAVDRPVAEAAVGWMIALSHHVLIKDRLVREARWDLRSRYMGSELRDKTLGVVGFGGIGRELVRLLGGFGMTPPLVYDPFVPAAVVEQAGCRSASLPELMQKADFVSLHCPLNERTRNLIGKDQIALMKPTAYFINTARGGIVDDQALYEALKEKRIAGAAIDCFVGEPLTSPPPYAELDNVLLAPHCIAWTEELYRDMGRVACQGMLDLAHGKVPHGVVNRDVFDRPSFQAKWRRLRLTPS